MTISMHEASAPRFINMLKNLSAILDKAQAYAEAKKIAPTVLPAARLFPDMFPLSRQVQIACDHAKGAVARLAGIENPKFEDSEQTLEELKTRIAQTIAFVSSVPAVKINGSEDKEVAFTAGGRDLKFTGMQYLLGYAQPNFYFHLVTAYDILRHNGVDIGKRDYIGTPYVGLKIKRQAITGWRLLQGVSRGLPLSVQFEPHCRDKLISRTIHETLYPYLSPRRP